MYCWPLEAVEGGSCCHSVGTHVLEEHPVANLQLGHGTALHDAVQAVARRAPDAARVAALIWLGPLRERVEGNETIGAEVSEAAS